MSNYYYDYSYGYGYGYNGYGYNGYGYENEYEFSSSSLESIQGVIENGLPIDDTLHVIMVVSNPCLYERRYELARRFIQHMTTQSWVTLYVVELCYQGQSFQVIDSLNPRHLALYTDTIAPLWHKENMINIGVRRLLPPMWRAMAWIDADIHFCDSNWAMNTLKILNGTRDVVQIFQTCLDLGSGNQSIINRFTSAGYIHDQNGLSPSFGHPGFAWACNRLAFERMEGLFDKAILGSGDNIMLHCLLGKSEKCIHPDYSPGYKQTIVDFQNKVQGLTFGYVPGTIKHSFHGDKKNRRYTDRWQILIRHHFCPFLHIEYDESSGIIQPTKKCPQKLLSEIMEYFWERKEFGVIQNDNDDKDDDEQA